jgi:hypothetical protein
MKRLLLLTFILLTVTLAGLLHGNYTHRERMEYISLSEAYKNLYPETLTFDPLTNYPF